MLPPGWRTDSLPRTMLAWLRAMAKELVGAAIALGVAAAAVPAGFRRRV